MGVRESVNGRWFINCDTDEERVFVSTCHMFQKPGWPMSAETQEAVYEKAVQAEWVFVNNPAGVQLAFCAGCVPGVLRLADTDLMRKHLLHLASRMSRRELAVRRNAVSVAT